MGMIFTNAKKDFIELGYVLKPFDINIAYCEDMNISMKIFILY